MAKRRLIRRNMNQNLFHQQSPRKPEMLIKHWRGWSSLGGHSRIAIERLTAWARITTRSHTTATSHGSPCLGSSMASPNSAKSCCHSEPLISLKIFHYHSYQPLSSLLSIIIVIDHYYGGVSFKKNSNGL